MSSKIDTPDLPINAIYQIGSSSKSFLAVVALQLADEINPETGKKYFGDKGLDATVGEILDNPISSSAWNAQWNQIPLRQLLNMTSGIPDYALDLYPAYSKYPTQYISTDDLLQIAANKKPDFEHGHGWQYSNTGYVIMNKIISYVTKSSIKEQINNRIINKLGLTYTYYVEHLPLDAVSDSAQKSLLMSGYFGNKDFGGFSPTEDISLYSLSFYNAAGSIISNTEDMNKYIHALFSAKNGLLTQSQLNQLTYMVATEDTDKYKKGQHIEVIDQVANNKYGLGYGLGVMEYFVQLPDGRSLTFYSHGGTTWDFNSNWIYIQSKQVYLSYAFNSDSFTRVLRKSVENKLYEKIANECLVAVSGKKSYVNKISAIW
ncbi:MAG: D-alanyl-D-alanine carboxypeptidase [Burkholderiales bacterium]|jgi:D-alanyl-D-alanine carboxypeptidase|nr:D-alanyl-D-alanine carboxypeptidase [Burkholderiales bacterium]